MNKKSHVPRYVMTLRMFGAPKSYAFKRISKRCSINSTSRVELKKDHVKRHVRCKGSCLTKVKTEKRQRF